LSFIENEKRGGGDQRETDDLVPTDRRAKENVEKTRNTLRVTISWIVLSCTGL